MISMHMKFVVLWWTLCSVSIIFEIQPALAKVVAVVNGRQVPLTRFDEHELPKLSDTLSVAKSPFEPVTMPTHAPLARNEQLEKTTPSSPVTTTTATATTTTSSSSSSSEFANSNSKVGEFVEYQVTSSGISTTIKSFEQEKETPAIEHVSVTRAIQQTTTTTEDPSAISSTAVADGETSSSTSSSSIAEEPTSTKSPPPSELNTTESNRQAESGESVAPTTTTESAAASSETINSSSSSTTESSNEPGKEEESLSPITTTTTAPPLREESVSTEAAAALENSTTESSSSSPPTTTTSTTTTTTEEPQPSSTESQSSSSSSSEQPATPELTKEATLSADQDSPSPSTTTTSTAEPPSSPKPKPEPEPEQPEAAVVVAVEKEQVEPSTTTTESAPAATSEAPVRELASSTESPREDEKQPESVSSTTTTLAPEELPSSTNPPPQPIEESSTNPPQEPPQASSTAAPSSIHEPEEPSSPSPTTTASTTTTEVSTTSTTTAAPSSTTTSTTTTTTTTVAPEQQQQVANEKARDETASKKTDCNHLPTYETEEIQKVFREETTFRNGTIKGKFTYINFDQRYRLVHYTRLPYGPVKIDLVEELGKPAAQASGNSGGTVGLNNRSAIGAGNVGNAAIPSNDIPNAVLQLRNILPNSLFGFPFVNPPPVTNSAGGAKQPSGSQNNQEDSSMYLYTTDSISTPNLPITPHVPVSILPGQRRLSSTSAPPSQLAVDTLSSSFFENLHIGQQQQQHSEGASTRKLKSQSDLFGAPMITDSQQQQQQYPFQVQQAALPEPTATVKVAPPQQQQQQSFNPFWMPGLLSPQPQSSYQQHSPMQLYSFHQPAYYGRQFQPISFNTLTKSKQDQSNTETSYLNHQSHQPHSHEHFVAPFMFAQPVGVHGDQQQPIELSKIRLKVKTSKALNVDSMAGAKSAQLRDLAPTVYTATGQQQQRQEVSYNSPAQLHRQFRHRAGKQHIESKSPTINTSPIVYHVLRNPGGQMFTLPHYNPGHVVAYDSNEE